MSNGSRRLSRGDRRRNDRLAALRAVVTRHSAVLAFDLAADKQVCALTDQDSRVLARCTVKAKAWQLREAVEWGMAQAAAAGFSSVVVACEPTGHRWRVLDQITAEAGVRLVCVQPLLVHRARESEDFTHNKSDETEVTVDRQAMVKQLGTLLAPVAGPIAGRVLGAVAVEAHEHVEGVGRGHLVLLERDVSVRILTWAYGENSSPRPGSRTGPDHRRATSVFRDGSFQPIVVRAASATSRALAMTIGQNQV